MLKAAVSTCILLMRLRPGYFAVIDVVSLLRS